jgi:chaperonin GroES
MKIKPMQGRIVVKEIETVKKSTGGLILTEAAADKPNQGIVIAVGPGNYLENGNFVVPGVNEGDKVLFVQGSGQLVKVEDEEYRILQEDEILAIIK